MEQDYYLPREEENTETGEDSKKNSWLKEKLDPHISILALQGGICLLVIATLIIIKVFFGDFFGEIKDWYGKNIDVDTDLSLVLDNSSGEKGIGGPYENNNEHLTAFVMPISGSLTSSYGYRTDPFTGETAVHNGLDIAATKGSEIKAALDGTVIFAANTTGDYGNYIILDHGGFQTLYGHCETLCVKKGQKVSAGDVIATCGSTGRSTGPHLHFEIRIGDKKIDPTPFLIEKIND